MNLISLLFSLLGLGCSFLMSNVALASDAPKLIHIKSDSLLIDYNNNTAHYQGNVEAHQESNQLQANTLTLNKAPKGIKKMQAWGSPATSVFTIDPNDGPTHTQSDTIIFEPKKNLLSFQNHAIITNDDNVFQGHLITYNTLSKVISYPSDQTKRGTMVIEPYQKLQTKED